MEDTVELLLKYGNVFTGDADEDFKILERDYPDGADPAFTFGAGGLSAAIYISNNNLVEEK